MDIEQSVVENLRKSVNDNGVNSQKENEEKKKKKKIRKIAPTNFGREITMPVSDIKK